MPKRTYHPSKAKLKKKLGFRVKMSSPGGRKVIKRRRLHKRVKIV